MVVWLVQKLLTWVFLILCCIDVVVTQFVISHGGHDLELNPVLDYVLRTRDLGAMLFVKFMMDLAGVILLMFLCDVNRYNRVMLWVNFGMLTLVVYELINMVRILA